MGVEAGSTNRWRTARERNRLRARYLIQSRVASRVNDNDGGGRCCPRDDDAGATNNACADGDHGEASYGIDRSMHLSVEETNTIVHYLRAVIHNDLSAFSVASLARDGHLLNGPVPTLTFTTEDTAPADAPVGLSTGEGGATSLNEAQRALAAMLSTVLPWEAQQQQPPIGKNDAAPCRLEQSSKSEQSTPVTWHPQPTTLATSKYGTQYVAERLVPYMQRLKLHQRRHLTIIEYASLLGRHGIVLLLLLGGLDPTVGNVAFMQNDGCEASNIANDRASRRVMALLHSIEDGGRQPGMGHDEISSTIPLSMWCYMIRAVIEMRMNGALNADGHRARGDHSPESAVCSICQRASHLIQFGSPCHHAYCEACMWNHLVGTVPHCTDLARNIVTCPVCDEEFQGFQCQEGDRNNMRQKEERKRSTAMTDEKKEEESILSINNLSLHDDVSHGGKMQADERIIPSEEVWQQRRAESLAKFMALPANSRSMKSSKRKRRREKDPAHGTWEDALRPTIQGCQTKDVRTDRFFRAVLSSPHLLLGYLSAGVDVNSRNVYGQTALYLACWKGPLVAVRWLLEYRANAGIAANGGSTCHSVAAKYDRRDVLQLLDRFGGTRDDSSSYDATAESRRVASPQVTILIDPTTDHPGAGACTVDNAVAEDQLRQLRSLWESIPTAEACEEEQSSTGNSESNGTSTNRPSRSYFCDAEEKVQSMLEGCVEAARMVLASPNECEGPSSTTSTRRRPLSSVFKHLRFLGYEQPGGVLPPHIDLCRMDDDTGLRSTHTFILYLTDCDEGGGTALLNHLKESKVLAVAQPRRGRALIFPHVCPHAGLEVGSEPKLLLRGEVLLDLPADIMNT